TARSASGCCGVRPAVSHPSWCGSQAAGLSCVVPLLARTRAASLLHSALLRPGKQCRMWSRRRQCPAEAVARRELVMRSPLQAAAAVEPFAFGLQQILVEKLEDRDLGKDPLGGQVGPAELDRELLDLDAVLVLRRAGHVLIDPLGNPL